jgi:hypothetical protein
VKATIGWILAAVFALALLGQLGWLPEMTAWGWAGWALAVVGWAIVVRFLYELGEWRWPGY